MSLLGVERVGDRFNWQRNFWEGISIIQERQPTIKSKNRNRNEENRRQIIDFIADNGISDSKTISKAIVAYGHLQRHKGQKKWACKT